MTETERAAFGDDGVAYMSRELGLDVQFPTQLADGHDARRANASVPDGDFAGCHEGESFVRQVGVCESRKQLARTRPHDPQHAVCGGHVGNDQTHVLRNMLPNPGKCSGRRAHAGDDHVVVFSASRDRNVCLVAAPWV